MKLMQYFRDKYLDGTENILDIGSMRIKDNETYRQLFPNYIGMDVESGPNVDIVGYNSIVDVYDIVISGQVMEHVKRPWEWLKNLTQYYRKYICIITPNTAKQHRYPIDTYRYFPDGMRDLFEYAGITEVEIFKNKKDTVGIGAK